MSVSFRPMRRDEIEACADLWVETWADTYPQIDFAARRGWFVERFTGFVNGAVRAEIAVDGTGQILGLVSLDTETGHVDQFAVARAARGSGIAHRLMDHAKRLAPGRLHLDVNRDNARAVRFYEREGFVCTHEGVSASGVPVYFYEWTLKD